MNKYAKAYVALGLGALLAGLIAAQGAMGDGVLSTTDWLAIAIAVIGVPAAVYQTPNTPPE
jgi:hypothetical protein